MANLITKVFNSVSNLIPDIVKVDAPPRKGDFNLFGTKIPMNGMMYGAGSTTRKQLRQYVVNSKRLKDLSNMDPITWAIKTVRKQQVSQMRWDIVADVDTFQAELDRWEDIEVHNVNAWGIHVDFKSDILPPDIVDRAKSELTSRKFGKNQADKVRAIRAYFGSIFREVQQRSEAHRYEVKKVLERPNEHTETNFKTLLDLVLDDILVFDTGVIVKNRNLRGDKVVELYPLPGQDVFIYRNDDRTIPQPPQPAYVWEDQGHKRAEFNKDELIYIQDNIQQNGYGMSPLEVAIYVITASLYAENFNLEFFKHNNIPPAVLNLGKEVSEDNRKAFQAMWESEMRMGGGLHKLMFMSGADDPKLMPLQNFSAKDMQMLEYLKWTLTIKCVAYQISPQDIGFVQDFHRTTAQVQKELSKARGLKSLLLTIRDAMNSQFIKKDFPFKDVKFDWLDVDLQDPKDQQTIDAADIKSGVLNINERRKKLGLKSIPGGDVYTINLGNQILPVDELLKMEAASEGTADEGGDPAEEDPENPDPADPKALGEGHREPPKANIKPDLGIGNRSRVPPVATNQKMEKSQVAKAIKKWESRLNKILGK